jgi:putative SOS response-associated peptidase YedK
MLAIAPRFNIAPSQDVFTVRMEQGAMRVECLRWGLVPFWAKDPAIGQHMINARAETLAEKPSFRQALRRRRCLIPASGFYEWQPGAAGKQPWFISPAKAGFMAFAWLWEEWQEPAGQLLRTCTIITTAANPFMARLHQRMPVILAGDSYAEWLNPATAAAETDALLARSSTMELQAWSVSRRVNSPLNDADDLVEPQNAAEG